MHITNGEVPTLAGIGSELHEAGEIEATIIRPPEHLAQGE